MAGILELPKDIPLQLFIYLSNMESYKVMAGSRISVSMAQQDYQAFHIAQPFPVSQKSLFCAVMCKIIFGSKSQKIMNLDHF